MMSALRAHIYGIATSHMHIWYSYVTHACVLQICKYLHACIKHRASAALQFTHRSSCSLPNNSIPYVYTYSIVQIGQQPMNVLGPYSHTFVFSVRLVMFKNDTDDVNTKAMAATLFAV